MLGGVSDDACRAEGVIPPGFPSPDCLRNGYALRGRVSVPLSRLTPTTGVGCFHPLSVGVGSRTEISSADMIWLPLAKFPSPERRGGVSDAERLQKEGFDKDDIVFPSPERRGGVSDDFVRIETHEAPSLFPSPERRGGVSD